MNLTAVQGETLYRNTIEWNQNARGLSDLRIENRIVFRVLKGICEGLRETEFKAAVFPLADFTFESLDFGKLSPIPVTLR